MNSNKLRTPERIFADMHRELRSWNHDIPESPERMDPILKIIMQLFASQLSSIDTKIEKIWEVASNSLIKALCPESLRWPVPSFTVMRSKPSDPVVEVDPHTRFFYKEDREGGQTFFFSPQRKEKLVAANVKHIFYKSGSAMIDLSPRSMEVTAAHTRVRNLAPSGESVEIYIGIEHDGPASDFSESALFLKGSADALKQLRWACWLPGDAAGFFTEKAQFCPGLECDIEKMFMVEEKPIDWGGLRKSGDLFKSLEENFIILPLAFVSNWSSGPPASNLEETAADNDIEIDSKGNNLFWIKLVLPSGGDKFALQSPFEMYFNCFIVVNKSDLTLFKHTGGNRLVEIELPEKIENILEIIGVSDSNGRQYFPRHDVFKDKTKKFYSMEERDNKLVLWFDYSGGIELPPDSITLNYSITSGVDANGIEAGKITELYENHPGISETENITPVSGAIPAKTEQQIIAEVSARLRNRDRALSFSEISTWARTFDPRITQASCRNGVERSDNGVRRCIIVDIAVKQDQFYSKDEIELLKTRIRSFLKARSPINSQYKVEIVKK